MLIADAQTLFADALAMALRKYPDIDVVGEYPNSGLETEQAVSRLKTDVLLLDFWIKGMDGVTAIHRILAVAPEQKIILLGSFHSPGQMARGIAAGAGAAFHKATKLQDLVDAIHKLSQGEKMVLASTPRGGSELSRTARRRLAKAEFPSLTPKEIQVLELLARGLSPSRIATGLSLKLSTVRTHINNILRKTESGSALEAVVQAVRAGLIR